VKQILVAGSTDGDDKDVILATIQACQGVGVDIQIVYRPHPQNLKTYDLERPFPAFRHVELILGHDTVNPFDLLNQIKASDLIVCHLSTLVLEGLINQKPMCIPVFAGKSNSRGFAIGYDHLLYGLEHFKGIAKHPLVKVSRNISELTKHILTTVTQNEFEKNDTNMDWYCQPGNFSSRLIESLETIRKDIE
jgi:hypothetical protein